MVQEASRLLEVTGTRAHERRVAAQIDGINVALEVQEMVQHRDLRVQRRHMQQRLAVRRQAVGRRLAS